MKIKNPWNPLRAGSIILTVWSILNGLVGFGCVVYIVILHKNAPGLLMLFKPSEIPLLDSKVLATTNAIAIIANSLITTFTIAVLFIIWKALMKSQTWAFWCLLTTIFFTQIAAYLSDAWLGNLNIGVNHLSTIMVILGLGLSGYGIFYKGNKPKDLTTGEKNDSSGHLIY